MIRRQLITALIVTVVMTVALVITLVLGYVRFVRGRKTRVAPAEAGAGGAAEAPAEVAGLEARVEALEKRLDEAAGALGHKG